MAGWFFVVAGSVAVVLVVAAWRVVAATRRASLGQTPLRLRVESGRPGERVALRLHFSRAEGRGSSTVRSIAVEGDLARVLAVRAPMGFTPDRGSAVRYEDFEPDLEALAHRLDEERPRTVDVSRLIQQLQREQFESVRRDLDPSERVQFKGRMDLGEHPVVVELPGQPIPEASGRIWIRASHRIGASTIDEVVTVELPAGMGSEPTIATGIR